MDFIARLLNSLSDRVRAMTPGARVVAGVLFVAIVASVFYLANHPSTRSEVMLFGGEPISPRELEAMEAAFGKAGLKEAVVEGNRIRVPRGKQADYMGALADAGALPHHLLDSLKKSWETGGLLMDRRTREGLHKANMQELLGKIVSKMQGVEWAAVLYNEEPPRGLDSKRQVTVSVNVQPLGNQLLSAKQVEMIRLAVAPPLGAKPEDVAVVDYNGASYPAGAAVGTGHDRYLATKLQYEQEYTENISRAMAQFVTGAVVTVNVELHRELDEIENSMTVDPPNAAVSQSADALAIDEQSDSDGAAAGDANVPAMIGQAVFGSPTDDPAKTVARQKVSYRSRQVRRVGLTPKSVTVSVAVPSSYFENVLRERQRGAADDADMTLAEIESEECKKIQRHVMLAVPWPEEQKQKSEQYVAVTKFQHFPQPTVEAPTATDRALAFVEQNGAAIGVGFLGLVGLLVVRSMFKPLPARVEPATETTPAAIDTDALAEDVLEINDPAVPLRRRDRPTLREELSDLVRDDPDAAAKVLRSWIGSAN